MSSITTCGGFGLTVIVDFNWTSSSTDESYEIFRPWSEKRFGEPPEEGGNRITNNQEPTALVKDIIMKESINVIDK
ncbi:hypothetical protein KIN20_018240 [Parelaphostrongylus tenuis]|uniref:Uncharacterized protein n=1 Tax=Parelaphostrongylus tenuis TaxID=148309 RepID=A0AAD5QU79_PARTN|nr:hypothetical protein KIN20_018240 [Parelaphostrongylus tenuis]